MGYHKRFLIKKKLRHRKTMNKGNVTQRFHRVKSIFEIRHEIQPNMIPKQFLYWKKINDKFTVHNSRGGLSL